MAKREWSAGIARAREALYQMHGAAAVAQFDTELGELADLADENSTVVPSAIAVCRYLVEQQKVLADAAAHDSPLQALVRAFERDEAREACAPPEVCRG